MNLSLAILLALAAAETPVGRPLIGDPAPSFALATLDGRSLTRDQLKGRITVVEFYATWCVPCARSLEDLRAIRAELGPELQVLIIAVEPDSSRLRARLSADVVPQGAIVALASDQDSARSWGRDRWPTSFFIDRAAIIRHINRGHGPGFRARATRWLRGLLGRP